MSKLHKYASSLCKIIIGVTLIVSSLLKLSAIDSFELYIFSLDIFNLELSALAARFVIGLEVALGVGYIINIYHKQIYYATLATTASFTLLLVYLITIGREDNCHCFGDIVDISPLESIIKNIIIIALLRLSKNTPPWRFEITIDDKLIDKYKAYIIAIVCTLIAIPFSKYPIHSIYNIVNERGEEYIQRKIDIDLFNKFIADHPEIDWGGETKILAFYGTGCKFCKHSAQQIAQIVHRNNLDPSAIEFVFWGEEKSTNEFLLETGTSDFNHMTIDAKTLLNIVKGTMPTLIFYDEHTSNNILIHNIRSIEEKSLKERLKTRD